VSAGRKASLVTLIAMLALLPAGCGDDSAGTIPTTTTAVETAQRLPKLPPGWKGRRDRQLGYAIGIPPGWEVKSSAERVLLRSPDHLVAVTITPDRNPDALEIPLDDSATRALAAVPGYAEPLEPSAPRPFRGTPLDAAQTSAKGTAKSSGVKQDATVVVLRRDDLVNYTVLIAANASRAAARIDRSVALRMVRTLRDQPVEVGAAPGG
jgi:hypothetical protein